MSDRQVAPELAPTGPVDLAWPTPAVAPRDATALVALALVLLAVQAIAPFLIF